MTRILLALLLVAFPALAETSNCSGALTNGVGTISCTTAAASCQPPQPTATVQPCPPGQVGSITTTFSCVGSTWTPITTNGCTTPPPTNFPYESRPMPPNGATGAASIVGNLVQGVTYAFVLNGTPGQVSISPEGGPPLMGPGANWEVGLTKVPGDWDTAKTMGRTQNPKDGTWNTPYYAAQGGESGGLSWVSVSDSSGRPVVPKGETWYLDLRITTPTSPNSNAIYVRPPLASKAGKTR